MTDYYLDSVGGSNTSPFDTWAKAATSWSSLVGSVTPGIGDRVIIGNNHVENFSSTQTISTGGATLISSTTDAGSTITYTPAAAGKQFNWSSTSNDITMTAPTTTYTQMWGIAVQTGDDLFLENVIMHDCTLEVSLNTSTGIVHLVTSGVFAKFFNCSVTNKSTANNDQLLSIGNRNFFYMHGGSITTDRTVDNATHSVIEILDGAVHLDGVDLNGFTRDNLVSIGSGARGTIRITNCRLNTNTTDTYTGATIAGDDAYVGSEPYVLDNTTSTNTVLSRFIEDPFGKASTDTSIYLDASDGTTSYSDKVVTSALCAEFFEFFRYEMAQGFADFSTAKTLTVNFAQDGTATNLKDSEIWMEVQYPTSGNSSYSYVDDKASDNQTTANQTTNAEAWTGLSGTNTKQAMSVTTSSGKEGPYKVFIYVSKPSTTVYIDPKVNIT